MRILAIAGFFLLICLPMLVQISGLERDDGAWENRILAPAPRLRADPAAFPQAADAWLDDHFGLRRPLVELANRIRFAAFAESGNPQIAFGRHHQLFLTSHSAANPQQMLLFLCRGAWGEAGSRILAAQLAQFLDPAVARNPRTVELVVPTKTIVDAPDLPGWMRARCAGGHPALPDLLSALARMRPDLSSHVVYPLALMQSLRAPQTPYPQANFHWDGPALGTIAAQIAERNFHRPRLVALPLHTIRKQSDVAHLLPGVDLAYCTEEPDLAVAGIHTSLQIPALGASGAILIDLSRFTHQDRFRPAPRLLILSDSFGQAIAPWFAAYYGEVWHVSTNNLAQLSPARRGELVRILYDRFRPHDVLFVFHDFSQGFVNQTLVQQLWKAQEP